jgi:hypothetical protein
VELGVSSNHHITALKELNIKSFQGLGLTTHLSLLITHLQVDSLQFVVGIDISSAYCVSFYLIVCIFTIIIVNLFTNNIATKKIGET